MPIFRDDESKLFWDAVGAIEDEKLHDTLYEYGCKAQTLEHQLEKLRGDSDFRSHTCGGCAWASFRKKSTTIGPEKFILCRTNNCEVFDNEIACPAFVPREDK